MMALPDLHTPRYRSGSVARMLRLPVATLRIWERRYQVAAPATTPAGHRLYSAADVQRLALVKQLVDLGHAISSVASLDMAALQEVASTHASTLATMSRVAPALPQEAREATPTLRVLGEALRERVAQLVLPRRAEPQWRLLPAGPDALAAQDAGDVVPPHERPQSCDLLLVHEPALHLDALPRLQALAAEHGAVQLAVLYGFAPAAVLAQLRQAGMALQHDPISALALGRWLLQLLRPPATPVADPARNMPAGLALPSTVPPRVYDDAALADFAGLSSTIACECPRHVADLLVQLSNFERYCADCAHRSPEDADLHQYLGQVSGTARALFETALERIAVHEGLLPPG
jgi:MerR family transcriptional regulator, light-induced transcriptional regulator